MGSAIAVTVMVAALAVIFAVVLGQHGAPSPGPPASSPPVADRLASTPAAVPWAALATPSPTLTPTAAVPVPACTVDDVSASPLTWEAVGAGSLYLSGSISLRSSAPCSLPSNPSATLFDASGDPVSFAGVAGPPSVPVTLSPAGGPPTVLLQIGDHTPFPVPATVSMTLGDGDRLTLQIALSSVDTPSPGTGPGPAPEAMFGLGISVPGAAAPMPAASGLDLIGVSLTGDGAAAMPGESYDYTVTLTSDGTTTVAFAPCPTYGEGLTGSSSLATYQLNCAAASPIPPGGSETFEMQLPIAESTAPGQWDLTWGIQGGSIDGNLSVTVS
jgi:hypothetical protein